MHARFVARPTVAVLIAAFVAVAAPAVTLATPVPSAIAPPAPAKSDPVPPPSPTVPPIGTGGGTKAGTADDVVDVEGLGLRIRPPQPSLGKSETVDGVLRYEIVDGKANPRWWLRFQNLTSSKPGMSAADQLAAYLDTLKKNGKEYAVKVDEALAVAGAKGEGRLLFIETSVGDDASGMSGWAIVPTDTDRFLTCSIIATAADFATSLPAVRTALRGMEIRSTEAIAAAKRERFERGMKMLSFPKAALAKALAPEASYYRMYRPGANLDGSEDIEVGWLAVRVMEGQRGAVEASAEPSKLRGEDAEEGVLAILSAKSIVDARQSPMQTVDTEFRAWISWNRQEEVWSARSTQRQGEAERTSAQTGLRSPAKHGDPRPILRVINSSAGKRSRDPLEWAVPPNYLTQVELILLGKLLPKDEPAPAPFSSYAFDPKSGGLPQRIDTWRRNGDGTWTLETRLTGQTTPLVQTFDKNGERLKRVDVDETGTLITERMDPERLRALWKRKGLPVE